MQYSKNAAVKRSNIPSSTKKFTREFYNNDDVSRVLPYKKHTINIKIDGKKELRKNGICFK